MKRRESDGMRATYKIPEAALIAGCGERSLRRLIAEGKVPHLRFGRNIVLPRQSFLRWMEEAAAAETK